MTDQFSDLDRPALSTAELRRALVQPGGVWSSVRVVARTGSTQADLLARVAAGQAQSGEILIAEEQFAGQGRRGRTWVAPARAGLSVSVVLQPTKPVATWAWLPLIAGLAISQAVDQVAGVQSSLKWPNDVLIGERKVAGVLAEVVAGKAVVLGFGVNVHQQPAELPVPTATSLALVTGRVIDRQPVLIASLRSLERWLALWGSTNAAEIGPAYRERCATLGRQVRVVLPGGQQLIGVVQEVNAAGQLVLRTDTGAIHEVAAGDVVHVRPRAD